MSDIHVVGRACRLPGAPSVADLWRNLDSGLCTISSIPRDRWDHDRFFDPRPGTPGKTYTLAAGVIDGLWRFDPAAFGISPREAIQMDPQQRLCLELTWEAFEDAGLPLGSLAGRNIGVYAGASSLDYGTTRMFDAAGADAYFMIGNTLSLISNRVSHAFDLGGPSLTIDTACSSSLVALHHAVEALRAGRIEAAVVLGVNVLASPFSFIGFSQARMLAPDGVCRPFDAEGKGYVRAEGCVALLLLGGDTTLRPFRRHCSIAGTGINSDGRTVGVSLPSTEQQAQLLQDVYAAAGADPSDLAFVEAHGTGTRAGDPVEAAALGRALAKHRKTPLAIGSIKSNIGHLEPASGLAGVLKAMLALEHDMLPRSLNFEAANPDIPFEELNLRVAREPLALSTGRRPRLAGVNSFGFGGTNAHAIIADPVPEAAGRSSSPIVVPPSRRPAAGPIVVLSAASRPALGDLARQYLQLLAAEPHLSAAELAGAVGHSRELLGERAALLATTRPELEDGLRALASGSDGAGAISGRAAGRDGKTVLVFSGNGSQWAGMGRAAMARNADFAARFADVDRAFSRHAGWSLCDVLEADDLEQRLRSTLVAQPLLLAVQIATIAGLETYGVRPDIVLGHSVGEVAAAYASGALTLEGAVDVIVARSQCQEPVRGSGTMATVRLGEADAAEAIAECRIPGLEIAAVNSPANVTISGPAPAVRQLCAEMEARGVASRLLDLEYPFHSSLIEPARPMLVRALVGMEPSSTAIPLVSTVTGCVAEGSELGGDYWWENVRRPVRFMQAVSAAADLGGQVFIEIGPRPVLQTYLRECLAACGGGQLAMPSLTAAPPDASGGSGHSTAGDPIRRVAAEAIVLGARFDAEAAFGPRPQAISVALPTYTWQREEFRATPSREAIVAFGDVRSVHPLLGWPSGNGEACWLSHVDPTRVPWVADHRIDGHAIYPAAAYLETAHAAARHWLGTDDVVIRDMEIHRPMIFRDGETREVRVKISTDSGIVELASRPRLGEPEFELHASCRAVAAPRTTPQADVAETRTSASAIYQSHDVYAAAERHGNQYGPEFRRADRVLVDGTTILVSLGGCTGDDPRFAIDPRSLDAAFHGLFVRTGAMPANGTAPLSLLPVRCGELTVHKPSRRIAKARIDVRRQSAQSLLIDILLLDDEGGAVGTLRDARLASAMLLPRPSLAAAAYHEALEPLAAEPSACGVISFGELAAHVSRTISDTEPAQAEPRLLLEAAARRIAYDELIRDSGGVQRHEVCETAERQPDSLRRRTLSLALESSGLAERTDDGWTLASTCTLPPADILIRTVVAEHPAWIADCMLLQAARRGAPASAAMSEHFSLSSPRRRAALEAIAAALRQLLAKADRRRPPRVAVIGADGWLADEARQYVAAAGGKVLLCDRRPAVLDKTRLSRSGDRHVEVIDISGPSAIAEAGPIDLAVSGFSLGQLSSSAHLSTLAGALGADGAIIAAEPVPDVFHDVTHSREGRWFDAGGEMGRRPRPASEWQSLLARAGFSDLASTSFGDDAIILTARGAKAAPSEIEIAATPTDHSRPTVLLICDGNSCDRPIAAGLVSALAHAGRDVTWIRTRSATGIGPEARGAPHVDARNGMNGGAGAVNGHTSKASIRPAPNGIAPGRNGLANGHGPPDDISRTDISGPREVVFIAGSADPKTGECAATLHKRCLSLARLLTGKEPEISRLWLVLPRDGTPAASGDAMESALRAFARTAANELPGTELRVIGIAADEITPDAATRLARVIQEAGPDREIVIGANQDFAVRVRQGLAAGASQAFRHAAAPEQAERAVLVQGQRRGLHHLNWRRAARAAPGRGQVSIEVAAAGLNFRDVMWAMGLLPEEALEDGFAGPTLGFECSGHVTAVGEGVAALAPGDPVIAMAPEAFASHVTVAATAVAKLPPCVPLEAAATIPVAFLTAHYALDHLARLREGEWVLIHGAAGGVGLAALEIARAKGARVIATAGSEEKRDLLTLLGAEHVLSSRSLAFADDVARLTGGVDVVLNSLAGDAMEASLGVVKPFGRFLELGKRDFYANTRLGLRPFRRNVSYFGIDADQLLAQQGALASRLMAELMESFANGTYRPLPYRLFRAAEAEDAFRLMQQSGHIGKILLAPPDVACVPMQHSGDGFRASPDGAHVVIGGLGGFGLRTAVWLADHGARHIVLAGRSGSVRDAEQHIVEGLRARGVTVEAVQADVTRRTSLGGMLAALRSHTAIRGVVHAAAVLEDGLIASLDAAKLERVLAPKVTGAALLDELMRDDPLDYFLLYSSVTTLVGNPGQAAYVAANGYLEGLARSRRRAGLPALAVRWGAITDAGMLRRDSRTAEALSRRTGAAGLSSRQALDLLAEAIVADDGGPESAVITLAPMGWNEARAHLPLLSTPLFSDLASLMAETSGAAEHIDLASMIDGLEPAAAVELVARHLAAELAQILRMPAASIGHERPLPELGLDSLMAVELRLAASRKLGIEIPLSALADGLSVNAIAARMISTLRAPVRPCADLSLGTDLAKMHVAEPLASSEIERLTQQIADHAATGRQGP